LHFFLAGVGDQALVLGDHFLLDVSERELFRRPLTLGLNQATANHAGHATPPEQTQAKVYSVRVWATSFGSPMSPMLGSAGVN